MDEGPEQHGFFCRGVRGATTVREDTREEINTATQELLATMIEINRIRLADLASAIFTTTPDLHAAFPAEAARLMSPEWEHVPLLGAVEMDKQGAMPLCIRILLHWNTVKHQREITHVYLRGTEALRRR